MAYMLTAVITGPDVVEKIASNLSGGHHVELTAELALVPIAGTSGQNFGDEQPLLLEQAFPSRLASVLADASGAGPVAYLEAAFHGGSGEQASIVWDRRTVVLGPLVDLEVSPSPAAPINRALQRLGVRVAPPAEDEFATIGLGRHRWTGQWLADGGSPTRRP
jgi:hypothetical protein